MTELLNRPATPTVDRDALRRRGHRLRWRVDLLRMAGWASMAAAVALYLADGGLRGIDSPGAALVAVGIVFGLVATQALLLMLVLAARVPVVERTIGQVTATNWHREMGHLTVIGLVNHALFLIVGTATLDGVTPWGAFAEFWASTGDFGWAVLGLALLVVVSLSSVVAARRRLAHEVWHAIHLVTYLAVAVAIPHQFSMGGLFAAGWQRGYWMGQLFLVGAALLAFRVVTPIARSLRHRLSVAGVTRLGPDAISIVVVGRDLQRLGTRGGQYFNWRFLAPGLALQSHPFSVSGIAPDALRITVREVGRGTRAMAALLPGTPVIAEGPYGVFSDVARAKPNLVLIGAGAGIGPLRSLLEDSPAGHVTVILRGHGEADLFHLDEWSGLCRELGADLHVLPGPRDGERWLPSGARGETLATLVPTLADSDVFVCGPGGFIDAVRAEADALGVDPTQIHEERFDW